jgi:hypothetical protein
MGMGTTFKGQARSAPALKGTVRGKAMNIKVTLLTIIVTVLGIAPSSFAMKMDFKHHMGEIINSYLVIKNDLSSDNTIHVAEESPKIVRQAEKLEHLMKTTVHSGEFHRFHKDIDIHKLKEYAEKLANQPIRDARKHFKPLSEIVVKYVKLFGKPMNVKEEILYTFHCPMYDGGSDWVQAGKETANPFYGSSMLKCGRLSSSSARKSGAKMKHMKSESDSKHEESHGKHKDHEHH